MHGQSKKFVEADQECHPDGAIGQRAAPHVVAGMRVCVLVDDGSDGSGGGLLGQTFTVMWECVQGRGCSQV